MKKRIHITTDILKAHFTTAAVYAQRGRSSTNKWNNFARKPGRTARPGRRRVAHSVDTNKDETV